MACECVSCVSMRTHHAQICTTDKYNGCFACDRSPSHCRSIVTEGTVNNRTPSPPAPQTALIHRAMLLSGSALSPWATIPEPDAAREEVSQQMACHLDEAGTGRPTKEVTADITECLRSKPLEAIMGVRLPTVRCVSNHCANIAHQTHRFLNDNHSLCVVQFHANMGPVPAAGRRTRSGVRHGAHRPRFHHQGAHDWYDDDGELQRL